MNDHRRILVVGPSWVGDMVMAQSLFMTLVRCDPRPEIDVLAPAWSRPLLERMPEVRKAIDMPVGHGRLGLAERWRLARRLRAHRYHQAILLPNTFKSALVPYWAGIPIRTGWVGEMRFGLLNDIRRLDKQRYRMTVQRFVALAYPADEADVPDIPVPVLQIKAGSPRQSLKDLGLTRPPLRLLAICPGAEYGPAKRWPESYYGDLAARMIERGWSVWLFGSGRDAATCERVNQVSGGRCTDLSGRTSLSQAVDLLSLADAVVSNDSGLMHVAAALGRTVIALYGSSDPGFTPPLSGRARILSLGLECSPCFRRECPLGHTRCLNDLGVDEVLMALSEMSVE